MSLSNCYNFDDFRKLAKKKLPAPIFHYIDGGADDEVTMNRNTDSFNDCDLIPNILNSVGEPDLKTEVFGTKMDMPIFLSPTAMQSLYHPDGDKALLVLLKSLVLYTVCPLWHLFRLKKLQIFQVGQKFSSYIFIRTNL